MAERIYFHITPVTTYEVVRNRSNDDGRHSVAVVGSFASSRLAHEAAEALAEQARGGAPDVKVLDTPANHLSLADANMAKSGDYDPKLDQYRAG